MIEVLADLVALPLLLVYAGYRVAEPAFNPRPASPGRFLYGRRVA